MADYSIELGVNLRTSDIDTEINKYNGKNKLIKVKADLDPSDIINKLNSFKGKAIDVNTKLSTKGITNAIKAYTPKKKISLESDLSMDGVDAKINTHQAKPIKIGAELYKGALNSAIREQAGSISEIITVKAKLDDNAINKAISEFSSASSAIPIKVKPDFSDVNFDKVETLLGDYEVRTPLRVKVDISKTELNNQIKGFNKAIENGDQTKAKIQLKAEFRDGAITSAIDSFKTQHAEKLKIPLDLTFDSSTELDTALKAKMDSYKNSPMSIPVTLRPSEKNFIAKSLGSTSIPIEAHLKNPKAINDEIYKYIKSPIPVPVKLSPATKGFEGEITKTPIKVHATLLPEEINSVITNFKPASKINVGVKLDSQGINTEISKLSKPTQPIDVDVALTQASVNKAITNTKPTSLLKVGVDLQTGDINSQIEKINPSSKVKVYLDLTEDIDNEAKKQKSQAPILVNVKLDREDINKQIREFKTNTKLTVGVKLDFASHQGGQKGVPQQIKDYKTSAKIKVGVELDKKSIQSEISQFNSSTSVRISNSGGKQDIPIVQIARSADDATRAYRELLSLQSRIGSKQQAIAKLDTSKNQKEILELSNQVGILYERYQRLHTLFDGQFSSIQIDRLNRGFEITAEKISVIKSKAEDAKVSLDKISSISSSSDTLDVHSQNQAYKDLMGVLDELNSKRLQLNGLTASSPQASNEVQTLRLQIEQLSNEYDNLLRSFNVQGIQFTAEQWNKIETAMAKVGRQVDVVQSKMADKSAIQNQTQAFKELMSISNEIGSIEKNIAKLKLQGGNSNQIEVLENQLRTLQSTYQQLITTMDTPLTADQWSALYTEIAKTSDDINELRAKYADVREEFAKGIKTNIDNGKFNNQIGSIEAKFNKLGIKSQEVEDEIKELRALLSTMEETDDIESVTSDYQTFLQTLQTVSNRVDGLKIKMDEENRPEILESKREAAAQRLNGLFDEGSKAAEVYGARAEELRKELNQVGNVKGIDIINSKIKNLGTEIKNSHVQTKTWGTRLKEQLARYSNYLSIASVFMYGTQAVRSMFEQVKLIDSAMTELKKVTDETDASYNRFLDNAATRAKELGTTIDGLVSSTADFARLGYSFSDSQGLAEIANIYAVVGDEVEGVEGATESLISTMAAFKDQADGLSNTDFGMEIIDKFNKIGNEFAISSGGIGEAMKRSASSLDAANNTIDESIALITAANTVVQNPDKVGNAFKTISMRIRAAKTELEEAGESTEGMAESTATMRKEIMALSGVDIMLDNSTFKSTYQVMDELSRKWQDLTDIQQASIIELMAGKHQGNVFASLMANFDIARDALVASEKASGSAMAEHAKWSESLEARLLRLKAAWQSLSQTFMNSEFLKVVIESVIKLIDVLDGLIKNFGTLGTIGISTGLISIFKNKDLVTNVSKFTKVLFSSTTTFGELWDASDKAGDSIKSFSKSAAGVATGVGIAIAAISLMYNHYANIKEAAAEARQEAIETADTFLDSASSFEQAYIKYSGRTDLTAEEEAELTSAIQGTVNALDDKSSALQGIVDNSQDYLASLEAIKYAELEAANAAADRKKQEAEASLREAAIGWQTLDGSEVNIDLGLGSDEDQKEAIKIAEEFSEYFEKITVGKIGDRKSSLTLSANASTDEIIDYYNTLLDYQEKLVDAELVDTSAYEQVSAAIDKMSETINVYVDGIYEAAKAQYQLENGIPKTTEEYLKMREAILNDSEVSSKTVNEKVAIANMMDSEYRQAFDLSSVEAQARKFVGIIENYGLDEIGEVETFLNMRTAVNNNECSIGEYMSELNNVASMSEGFSDAEKEEFNLAFGIDVDSIKKQYDDVYKYVARNYLNNLNTDGMGSFEINEYITTESQRIQEFLKGLTASELRAVANIKGEINWETTNTDEILAQIKEEAELIDALNFTIDVTAETDGITALNTALSESKSAAGLTAESIESLKSRYQDLDGYNAAALFEETANGIRVNSTELEKLEKEYKDFNKQEIDDTLETLTREYNDLTEEITNCTDDQDKLNDLYDERSAILNQINNVASLAAQYEGLTSAYNEWQRAKEAGQDRDPYENVLSGREEIEEEMSRGWLDDAAVEYLELLSGKDLSTAGIDAQIAAYKELDKEIGKAGYSIWDFFTKDDDGNSTSDGVFNFFDTVKSMTNETAAWIDKNGKYNFDFEGFEYEGETGDAAIAKMLGTSEELVQLILAAAEDAGFVVNIEGDYTDLADAVNEAEKANDRMKELGATTYTFNFDTTNVESLNEQIGEAKTMLSNLKNEDGTLKVGVSEEDYRQARDIIYSLILQKQRLDDSAILHVDTEQAKTDIEVAISKLQEFKTNANTLEVKTAVGADTSEVTSDIQSVLEEINGIDANIKAGLGLDTEEVQTAISNIQANIEAGVAINQEDIDVVNAAISSISNEAMVELGLNTALIDNYKEIEQTANGVVNWDNNIEKVTTWINQKHEASGTVKWDDDTSKLKTTYTGKGIVYWDTQQANGTANANGTTQSGRAFAKGDWGIKGSGTALVGELGTEVLVRDGQYYTIGDGGAELVKYRQGDIIFNHKQTEELFKNGRVTSGGGRGKMFANGSAFSTGGGASGSIKDEVREGTKEAYKEINSGSNGSGGSGRNTIKNSVSSSSKSSSKSSSSSSDAKDEFEETIDWIETAISRIEREIDILDQKANNIYKSWSERNSALVSQISEVGNEIELQQQAYDRYMQEASSVGLSESYASKVRNGTLDIETITDEALKEKINDYKTWYEKALECEDAVERLRETESELYAQRVENAGAKYEGILGVIEHEKNMIDEYISQNEANGQFVSGEYYKALISNENNNIDQLEKQKASMLAELQAAMESGKIEEGSEGWYNMVSSIDEVTLNIEKSKTQIKEYEQTLQQLSWDVFDNLQEKISAVTEESDFLIELLSDKKLYDDNGKLTEAGMITMGLHGQNYNTNMYQADMYGAEAERLKKEMELDPFDEDLKARYREMISLQQEHILAAQGEKEAIRDMVEEGINLELDALQERIDKYNEALDSQKDLYDYQKKVKKQTEEIASLEKQMAAYSGDNSEEAKARVQELKVSLDEAREELQEAEYDKYISDQQQLLDDLYLEYETILNARLDNIDALMGDMISEINTSASTISAAIAENTNAVGYDLSESMKTIWNNSSSQTNGVITTYGDDFRLANTTTNNALNAINTNAQNIINQLNKIAKTDVKSASASSAANSKEAQTPTTTPTPTTPASTTPTPAKTIKVGGKINAGSAKIYDYAGDNSGETQYYKKDPIYTVLDEKNGYLKVRYHKLSSGVTGWFKKSDVKAYATGKKNFANDEVAWTQENGREFIIRPSDGAILTPLAKGDSVLNANASSNIWDMANSPSDFIKDNLNLGGTNIPNNSNVSNNYTQNLESVVFNLPNVQSYNELLSAMQKDKNFEKLILSMSIDRLVGKSSLAKNKSIR